MKKSGVKSRIFNFFNFCFILVMFVMGLNLIQANGNYILQEDDDDKYNKGVTVSPSHIEFNVDLGKVVTKKVKITNYTGSIQKFSVKYNDFDISLEGKSSFLDPGTSDHSLAKMLSIIPTFVELEPGKSADISITIQVPNDPEKNKAAWGVILIEQAQEKKVLDPGNNSGETIAFGITPSFAFGIWIYQNPPNVEKMGVDITKFAFNTVDNNLKMLVLSVENTGDGIAFCKAYSELTNIETGEQLSLGGKKYTILPGYQRNFQFELPAEFPKGKYSAVGVIDYDSDEEVVAAELDVTIE